nr:hypothetical protein [Tanacetum cinerariifolium]
MSTRLTARNLFSPFDNPELTIRRRSRVDPTLLNDFEMATEGNGDPPVPDLRTMEEFCQPSLNGREILALKAEMAEINKNLMKVLQINQQVKAVNPSCETCGGRHSYNDCPATVGQTQNVYATGAYQGSNSYQPQEEFKQPEFESYGPKSCEIESKNASKDIPNELKEYLDAPLVKDMVSDNKDCSVESPVVVEKKTFVPTIVKVEVVRPKQQEKPVRKTVKYAEMYKSQGPRGNQRN